MIDSLVFAVSQFLEMAKHDTRLHPYKVNSDDDIQKLGEVEEWAKKIPADAVGDRSLDNVFIKNLEMDIRDLSCWTENQLDACEAGIHDDQKEDEDSEEDGKWIPICCFRKPAVSSTNRKEFDKNEFGRRIRKIRDHLEIIKGTYSPAQDLIQRGIDSNTLPCDLVGRENEMKWLNYYLLHNNGSSLVSIFGKTGIGKTKLANQFYTSSDTSPWFSHFVWIHVSQRFERQRLLEDILNQFTNTRIKKEKMRTEVGKFLTKNNVLIVLDDICSLADWNYIQGVIPMNRYNKILITTESTDVAEKALWFTRDRSSQLPAQRVCLKPLSDKQGLELLAKNAPAGYVGDTMWEGLAKKIINHCGGMPSTIVKFLQAMATTNTLEKCEEMINQGISGDFSNWLEVGQTSEGDSASIYSKLPHAQKLLFLYMGVLQDDHGIKLEKLYHLWLADAQTSLEPLQKGESLLNTVEEDVIEIEEKGLVDLDETKASAISRFKYCQLNKSNRKLSLLKNEENCFFKVDKFAHGKKLVLDGVYRFTIDIAECGAGSDFLIKYDEKWKLRVLILSAKKKQVLPQNLLSFLAESKNLRVLDINGFDFEETVPEGIETWVSLRYLSFKDSVLRELPSSIGDLNLLCILDLRVRQTTKVIIHNVLGKMKKLRHLYLPVSFATHDANKLGLDGLTELETIENFNLQVCNVEHLLALPNLHYLNSYIVENLEELKCIIKCMTKSSSVEILRTSLKINNFDCYTEERHSTFRELLSCQSLTILRMEGHLCRIPMSHKFSENLIKIVFVGSELVEDPMNTLGKLPRLQVLVLDDAYTGDKIHCLSLSFVELKVLKLLNMECLKECTVEEEAMPKLSTLAIAKCRNLAKPPEGLQFLCSLKELKIPRMSNDFQDSIKKVNFQHSLSIICS